MNKRFIISLATYIALGATATLQAENQVYTFPDPEGGEIHGVFRRVSPNGVWVAGGDETDETGSMVINTADPTKYIFDANGLLLDIDDNGLAVGAYYDKIGYAKYKRAAIFKDGNWIQLPLPEQIIGQSYAVSISADSKTIAGHGMCENDAPDEPGKYFPMVWKLNEATGEYELHRLFNNLYLPGTSGFFIHDMTPDGRLVCGMQCLDMGDTIAAILDIETGEYKIWHQIEFGDIIEEYMGVEYLFENKMFVDGVLDGGSEYQSFGGSLYYATNKYIFGTNSRVSDVQEDGSGTITNRAAVYDIEAKDFIEGKTGYTYSCGMTPEQTFTSTGMIINNGQNENLSAFVGTPVDIATVYGTDDAGKILACSKIEYSPWGEPYESPVLVILDEPAFSGINDIRVDPTDMPAINVNGNTVNVGNAKNVQIYNTAGAVISESANATLAPGVYIIKADKATRKVIIK